MWKTWIRGEQGQDLVEYSLLLAFIVLAGAASYVGLGDSVDTLWGIVNNRLTSASN